MNESTATSAPGASLLPSGIDTLTAVHFGILALIALAVIAMIVAGMRRKRTRDIAAREVAVHAEEVGLAPAPEEPAFVAPPSLVMPDEPIAAAAPLEASPATEAVDAPATVEDDVAPPATPPRPHLVAAPAPTPAATAADGPNTAVTQLKGLGPKVATRLGELGITTVGHIAALSDEQAAAVDADLGAFSGRMARDRWVEQARFLAAGDRAGFEAVFGRL